MSLEKHYKTMAKYNAWMNERLYDLCATLPDELRKKDLGAFFKSIHATLNHLLFGDRAWMNRFSGSNFKIGKMGEVIYDDFSELHAARKEMDAAILDWVETIREEWLLEKFTWRAADGVERTQTRLVLVTHMFNHQTHHRGQITTLLTQQGYDIGVTDIPKMPDVELL